MCDGVVCRCVLELHAIAAKKEEVGGEFAVAMTAEERRRFLQGIKADFKEYYTMLGTVNAETSECSRPDDRASIHDGIRSSVGFGKLSRMVFGVLEQWMEGQLRMQVASCEEAGENEEAMELNRTLALVLSYQGRYADALPMFENVLEFQRRVLSADHPDIGEGCEAGAMRCMVFVEHCKMMSDSWFDVQARPWTALLRRTESLEGTRMLLRWVKRRWSYCVAGCLWTILA